MAKKRNCVVMAISFVAMVCVVACHARCGSWIEKYIISLIGFWSVPWFFSVSGYYFVKSLSNHGVEGTMRQKLKTLVIPYFLWCFFGLSVVVVASGFEGLNLLDGFGLSKGCQPTFNRPLWYVRTLFVEFVIAVIAMRVSDVLESGKGICDRMKIGLFSLVFLLGIAVTESCLFNLGPLSDSLFFLLGCIISMIGRQRFSFSRAGLLIVTGAFIGMRIGWFILTAGTNENTTRTASLLLLLSNLAIMPCLIGWMGRVSEQKINAIEIALGGDLSGVSVFIYFLHAPILWQVLPKVKGVIEPNSLWIFGSILYITMCLLLARLLKGLCPKAYSILVGGR